MTHSSPDKKFGYEPREPGIRILIQFLIGLMIMIVLVYATSWVVLRTFLQHANKEGSISPSRPHILPPEPRLEANPLADLNAVHRDEQKVLNSYGWVDRSKGIARIPIDRAMEVLANRGLPARKEGAR